MKTKYISSGLGRTVHEIRFDKISKGWEQWGLLRSDAHHDNEYSDWEFEKSHLEEAKRRGAFIIDAGDVYDLMQGKYDPRKDLDMLKEEHKGTDYLDRVLKTATRDYAPYAENFCVIGMGNHESSILDRLGTNMTDRLVVELNRKLEDRQSKHRVLAGGYSGWVLFRFRIQKTVQRMVALAYYHGSGGGAVVTRGVISTNRMAVYLPDADIVMTGHTHDQFVVPIARVRISEHGTLGNDFQYHVKTGTYKDERQDGYNGWAIQKQDGAPKIKGACWVRFYLQDAAKGIIGVDFTPALPPQGSMNGDVRELAPPDQAPVRSKAKSKR